MIFDKILPPARIHMIGIGGISMSGLAEILKDKGYTVTGSDINKTHITERLVSIGIPVYYVHSGDNINNASAVVYTASIKKDNPEYQEALNREIPLIDRAELLGELTKMFKNTIAISGTHGKTTTTGMISISFLSDNKNPTISIGGELPEINSNYRIGAGDFLITEACEYVESFLKISPYCSIVLNIEEDHLDYFKNIEHIKSSFKKFLDRLPNDGYAVINVDDDNCAEISKKLNSNLITFGIKNTADFNAKNINIENGISIFDLYKKGKYISSIKLSIPGVHNIYNALACLCVCDIYNLSLESTKTALVNFKGVKRRFELKGEVNGVKIYDDYAHHPSEIKATLCSARTKKPNKLWCVFQPHTFSRTKSLLTSFASSFYDADEVIILDVYAAREKDTGEINSNDLVKEIKKTSNNALYMNSFDDAVNYLSLHAKKGDMIFTIGAGNVYEIGEKLLGINS